ncbi:MAG: helix-turn-helix domain-containing protein [Acidobacteriia bacterium]|nr:helix-turn-helix transcriptional regulator [Methyloceanibacter sp.]MBX5471471.1 helix-turn-helix transcriptional regulator [Acetobacteraceae bacterium]MCL6492992.1 helix-turn-helix domain-containing protein [Terriglobia bacterium]
MAAKRTKTSRASTPGERIRQARLERGMTQEELAERVGVSRSAVAQWETDRAGQVGAHLTRIAQVLGVGAEYLLSGTQESARGDELALLRLYRACSAEDRALLLQTARRLAKG